MGTVTYDWVIASYEPRSDLAKYAIGLADEGIGYHILNKTRLKNDNVIVAFKFVANKPIPQHLQLATVDQVKRLETLDAKRLKKRD